MTFTVDCPKPQIAFSSDRQGAYDVYVVNDDGTQTVNLTNHTATDNAPSWDIDGSSVVRITENTADDISPAWRR